MLKTLSLSIFCVTTMALSALVGCSEDVGFTGGKVSSDTEPTETALENNTRTENFSALGNQLGATDIIWVVDNSGSMDREANHVRENLQAFTNYIDNRADVKMAVISRMGSQKNGVILPAGLDPDRFLHINQVVNSYDGLQQLVHHMNTSLNTFLRPDVDKTIVIVTDDNSRMSATDFTNAFHKIYPDLGYSVNGFIAFDKSTSPCGYRQGTVYEQLKDSTKGSLFNVCEHDWTTQFSKLAENVIAQVRTSFRLDPSVKVETVSKITINGKDLDKESFQLVDNVLSISNSALQGADQYAIAVTYTIARK